MALNLYKNTNIKYLYLKYIWYQILITKIKNVLNKKLNCALFAIDTRNLI